MALFPIVEVLNPHGCAGMEVERRFLLICDLDIPTRNLPSLGKVANALLAIQP
jgi:hypothetical protein